MNVVAVAHGSGNPISGIVMLGLVVGAFLLGRRRGRNQAKAKAEAAAVAVAGGGASDASSTGSGEGHAAVILQLNLAPGDADRFLPLVGSAMRQSGDYDEPAIASGDHRLAVRADGPSGQPDRIPGLGRPVDPAVRSVLPDRLQAVDVTPARNGRGLPGEYDDGGPYVA